jgi:Ca-activated chloride channel family protein
MDVSGSMRARDIAPSRIEASQAAAKDFIQNQPADVQIGIVAFAAAALLVQAPTLDREALNTAINSFDLRRGTAVGAGVLTSLATIFPDQDFDELQGDNPFDTLGMPTGRGFDSRPIGSLGQPDGPPKTSVAEHVPVEPGSYQSAVVILLTDGATTVGPDPIAAGRLASEYGVRVFTVGFGSTEGDVVDFGGRSMRAQLDAETLQSIADVTRAQYFEAQSADDLNKVYSSLSTKLISEKKLTEIAFLFAGIGALIALIGAGLSVLWFGRVA